MTIDEALDIVVARSKHERFRDLCDELNPDAVQRDAYRALVLRMASGEHGPPTPAEPAPTPPAESIRLTLLARKCPYRSKAHCGCSGAAWCAIKSADVAAATCWACVREHGI